MMSVATTEDLNVLFEGLPDGLVPQGTTTGALTVFGPRAFPILAGQSSADESRQVVAAGAKFGQGRIVALGNLLYTNPASQSQTKFLTNSITWATAGAKKVHSASAKLLFWNVGTKQSSYTLVGIIGAYKDLSNTLYSAPFTLQEVYPELIADKPLDDFDAVVIGDVTQITSTVAVEALKKLVRRGGGLIVGATPWTYQGDIRDFPANQICNEAGLGWTTVKDVTPINSETFHPNPELLLDTHGGDAWQQLLLNEGQVSDPQLTSVSTLAQNNLPESNPLAQAINGNKAVSYHDDDLKDLLRDLPDGVVPTGTVGLLSIYGPDAFTILPGKYSKDDSHQVVGAGGRYGNGRVTAFAHTCFTNTSTPTQHILLTNCVKWTANKFGTKIRVGILYDDDLEDWIRQNKTQFDFQYLDHSGQVTERLGVIDVLVVAKVQLLADPIHLQTVKDWIVQGGGLVVSATGWAQEGDLKTEFCANMLLQGTDIIFTGCYETTPIEEGQKGFTTKPDFVRDTNADEVWTLLRWYLLRKITLPGDRVNQMLSIIEVALGSLPNTGPQSLVARIKSDLQEIGGAGCIPAESVPLTDGVEKLKLKLMVNYVYNTNDPSLKTVAACQCHPATMFFPGLPPSDANAPRLRNHQIQIKTVAEGWYSTGLYAPPGDEITVSLYNPPVKKFSIQIGSHSDDISSEEQWLRCPQLTVAVSIGKNEVNLHNTFGGLIYLRQDEESDKEEVVSMTVSGPILAPYFIFGKTTPAEWEIVRKSGAPWGELESNKLILTLPGSKLAELENPIPLMLYWTKVLDAEATLAGISTNRPRPQRIVADVQIGGGGYMHSGYPIMIPSDESVDTALSIPRLKSPNGWGFYHELGHNHQDDAWTFELVSEITNNMFALYVYETVCKLTPAQARPDTFEPTEMKRMIEANAAKGPNYKDWADDPFLGLLFYYQLKVKYGWDAYKKVFKAYQTLQPKPASEQEKVDTWMVQFSLTVGQNLAPLFKVWGVEVTDEAVAKISHLPSTDQTLLSLIE